MPEHYDLCEIKWSAGELELRERLEALDGWRAGDYTSVLGPHTLADCPFNSVGDRIPAFQSKSDEGKLTDGD